MSWTHTVVFSGRLSSLRDTLGCGGLVGCGVVSFSGRLSSLRDTLGLGAGLWFVHRDIKTFKESACGRKMPVTGAS
ncbi:hypothetical protein [Paenibacillus sp. FSL H8-0034]|uniref:hypothetical protein n=1 Tax=Paenibacillus sp. FSL H8-0034 TaxID=2954671 RepID=UPI0030FC016F